MNLTRRLFFWLVLCATVGSFASGWLIASARRSAIPEKPRIESSDPSEPIATLSVPVHPPDLVALSFDELYRIIRVAPAETLRAYCDELKQLPLGPKRNAALTVFFKTLVQARPTAARQIILQQNKEDRWLPLNAIREAAMPEGMEVVADVLLSFDRGEISGCSFDLLNESLNEWGTNDPVALKEFLETHREQDVEKYFEVLARNWAAYDPEAARQWMVDDANSHPCPTPLADEEVEQPDGSMTVGDSYHCKERRKRISSAWVEGFLAYDSDGAINYALANVERPEVKATLFKFGRSLFPISPDRARDFVLQLPEANRSEVLNGIANNADPLVRNDDSDNATSPRYISEWLLQFPAKEWQDAMGWALSTWQTTEPKELFAWMADQPSQIRDAMVMSIRSGGTDEQSAQTDFDSLMQAEDPVLRMQLLERLVRGGGQARKVMPGILERAQLTSEEKSRLASLIPTTDYPDMKSSESDQPSQSVEE